MKAFFALLLAVGLTSAAHVAFPHPGQITSQYHSQDELGQYSYGYSGGPSAKEEIKTADGVTRGGYSYIDANGIVQSAAYVSDPVNGFRVAATNLPAGPAVPDKPAVIASAPVVTAGPALVSAPVVPAAVAAAPVAPAIVEPAHTTIVEPVHTAVVEPVPAAVVEPAHAAVVSDALPEVISARHLAGPYFRSAIAHPWAGFVHALKKRSIVSTYTNFPGSTTPLVHASPLVHATPIIHAEPIIRAAPVVTAHSVVHPFYSSPVVSSWTGLHHLLKKRSVLIAPYYAAPIDLHNAAATEAHLIQHHQEALRNTHGIIPLTNPADAPDVSIVKTHHLLTQAAEARRNIFGLHHYLKKRSIVAAAPLIAAPVAHSALITPYASPFVAHHAYTPAYTPLAHAYPYLHHW